MIDNEEEKNTSKMITMTSNYRMAIKKRPLQVKNKKCCRLNNNIIERNKAALQINYSICSSYVDRRARV